MDQRSKCKCETKEILHVNYFKTQRWRKPFKIQEQNWGKVDKVYYQTNKTKHPSKPNQKANDKAGESICKRALKNGEAPKLDRNIGKSHDQREMWEERKRNMSYSLHIWEAQNGTNLMQGDLARFGKITYALTFDPATPPLGSYPESTPPSICTRLCNTTLFVAAKH